MFKISRSLLSYEDHVTSEERIQLRFIIFSLQCKEVEYRVTTKKARTSTQTGTVNEAEKAEKVSEQSVQTI